MRNTPTGLSSALRVILLSSLLSVPHSCLADDAIDFERQIEPILVRRCLACHGPRRQRSGLRVDQRVSLLRGGDSGLAAVVPGKPRESYLLDAVRGDESDFRMPPEGDPLSSGEVAQLERWITQGAVWPGQMDSSAGSMTSDHWSLQPLVRPAIPLSAGGTVLNPIDAFIQRRLRAERLEISPAADARTMVRRVTLDLTGLPPSPRDVERFVAEAAHSATAYGRLVDRLLASPRYGERWAQHWLDVIRWAETVGFETNQSRPNAWPYRDWVIASLNRDQPYDRFVFEQLAGDVVGQDAALGFLVAGPANLPGQIGRDEEAMRAARQDELDEVIQTVSQALMGLTIGCARCHNHKFDPILQRDYYALQAVFAGLAYGQRRWRGPQNDAWTSQLPAARRRLAAHRAELEAVRQRHGLLPPLQQVHTERFEPLRARALRMTIDATTNAAPASLYELEVWSTDPAAGAPRNVALAAGGATPSASSFALANQTRHFDNLVDGSVDRRQAFPWVSATAGPAWVRVDFAEPAVIDRVVWHSGSSTPADYRLEVLRPDAEAWTPVADTRRRLPRIDDRRAAQQVQLDGLSSDEVARLLDQIAAVRDAERELVRLAAGPQVYAASFTERPGPTWLLRRGDPMQRGQPVAPDIPEVLGSLDLPQGAAEVERRLQLAQHLTQPHHPLTARVIVNRVWQHHFGTGLVQTPSDFGEMGSRPTHPGLLDWLAVELVESGWSLKRLHRLIVHSHTYRQTSGPRSEALRVDAACRLLWRFPPRRLEAEAIRDSILSVSGKLNLEMGGPGFDFFNQRGGLSDYTAKEIFSPDGWRRMVYAHKIRMQAVDIFGAFDCPDAGQMKPRRTRSITPLQSLSLWNSPFTTRQAVFFAQRVRGAAGECTDTQVELAFQLALGRPPDDGERTRMEALASGHGLEQVCRVLLNCSEFLFLQ